MARHRDAPPPPRAGATVFRAAPACASVRYMCAAGDGCSGHEEWFVCRSGWDEVRDTHSALSRAKGFGARAEQSCRHPRDFPGAGAVHWERHGDTEKIVCV